MSAITAFDMGRFHRIVGIEHPRIRGDFAVMQSNREGEFWIEARDLTIWDDGHNYGVILNRNDLRTSVKDGVVDFHERDISERRRADVLDVLEEMKRVILAACGAAAFQGDDFKSQVTVEDDPQPHRSGSSDPQTSEST